MNKLSGLFMSVCVVGNLALADHGNLLNLSTELTRDVSELYQGARRVIGPRPTWRQWYAFEHISFLHNSAHRFDNLVKRRNLINDHDHDMKIRRAYRDLEHDVYYARQTFSDLFRREFEGDTNDHSDYLRLDRLLRNCEDLVQRQIPQHLP